MCMHKKEMRVFHIAFQVVAMCCVCAAIVCLHWCLLCSAIIPQIFKAYIFGCVSVTATELLMQVLCLLKFRQKISYCSTLHVSTIPRLKFDLIVCTFHGIIFARNVAQF